MITQATAKHDLNYLWLYSDFIQYLFTHQLIGETQPFDQKFIEFNGVISVVKPVFIDTIDGKNIIIEADFSKRVIFGLVIQNSPGEFDLFI